MMSTNSQRISEIFKRLAEIAKETANVAIDPTLTQTQKQQQYDDYFREHDELTKEAQDIFGKPGMY